MTPQNVHQNLAIMAIAMLSFTPLFVFADTESGLASVYNNLLHGHATACGGKYNKHALTAAHKTLPCGTQVKITNSQNGKTVLLRVNDRGPFLANRIIDISKHAAEILGMRYAGILPVNLEVINENEIISENKE